MRAALGGGTPLAARRPAPRCARRRCGGACRASSEDGGGGGLLAQLSASLTKAKAKLEYELNYENWAPRGASPRAHAASLASVAAPLERSRPRNRPPVARRRRSRVPLPRDPA